MRQPLAGRHTRATYSPDGKALVAAGAPQGWIMIEKYDAETGQLQASWPTGAVGLTSLVCGPDGLVAAATSGDRPAIKLFRLADGREVGSLEGHVGTLTGLAFSPDGRRLVSAGSDFTVRLWHTGSGRELLTFREHTDVPVAVAWSPDGRWVGSGGDAGMIKVWGARAAETAPPTDDWPVLFRDDFPADGAADGWHAVDGSWEVRGGALRGRMANKTYAGATFPIAQAVRLKTELPRTVEVRLAYRANKPVVMGVNLVAPQGMHVYTALLCGGPVPFGQPCAKLQQVTEGVKVSYIGVERPFTMQPGRWHHVRVLREPERIRTYVDGVECLSERIPDVELTGLMLQAAWGDAGDEVEFKDIEVRAPPRAGP